MRVSCAQGCPAPRRPAGSNNWDRPGDLGPGLRWSGRCPGLKGETTLVRLGQDLAPPVLGRDDRGAAKMPEENIFLFVPNLIGECCLRPQDQRRARNPKLAPRSHPVPLASHPKVMLGLSSPSFPSTLCPAAPSRPPPSIYSADF